MVGKYRRAFFLLFFLSAVIYIQAQQPLQMASLRPAKELVWQRTSPSPEKPDGPVLYQILFRSSAHIGSIPKIGPTYTLVDSLISDDGSSIHIGGMSVNGSTGIISFAGGQTFSGVTTVNGISGAVALGAGDRISIVASGQTLIIGDSIPARWGTFSGSNIASGQYSTVAGGYTDTASGGDSTVAGGESNTASGGWSTVAGGYTDTASGGNSTVAGGGRNTASGQLSTVAGGWANTASGSYSFIAGGQNNTTGNIASPGTAGQGAFAAGQNASADQDGCFVWGDNSTTTPTTCGATNRFVVRAAGGAQFSNGVNVDTSGADGGGFSNNNFKNLLAFGALSGEAIGSQRTSTPGTNQFGLDFYTNFINRMFIDQGGTVHVVGNLTKGGGSFQIDHPLDPANKYLSHSFVESPDMMNIYNGNAVLDGRGQAWVSLPDWFEALNMDFRYQLTPIGNPGQHILYIAQEIANNRFKIAGGRAGARVSWQVSGIRHDAYANAHRIQVEEDKGDKRGTYLHPELIGTSAVAAGGRP